MRDSQREKVYQAEYRLRDLFTTAEKLGNPMATLDGIPLVLPPEARFGDIASIQHYCDRVLAMLSHETPVHVRQRRGGAFATYKGGVIAICPQGSRWAMREIVVLHEVAHHLSVGHQHGPQFVAAFNRVLTEVMGPQVGLAYRVLCAHEGAREGVCA